MICIKYKYIKCAAAVEARARRRLRRAASARGGGSVVDQSPAAASESAPIASAEIAQQPQHQQCAKDAGLRPLCAGRFCSRTFLSSIRCYCYTVQFCNLYVLVARLWVFCARAEEVPLGSCHEYWLAGYRAPGAYSVQKTLPIPSLYCASIPAASLTLASAAASCTVSPQMPTPFSADTLPYAAFPALFSVADHTASRRPFLLVAPTLLPPNVPPPTASSTPNATQNKSSGNDESGLFVSQLQYACGLDALALARRSAYCTQRLRFWCYRSSIKWAPTRSFSFC